MSVFDRVRADEEAGDLGSARKRLAAHAAAANFDPGVCEQIARLSMRMHDPVEAGRWYFLCDSPDLEASAAIDRFIATCAGNCRQTFAQLPGRSRWTSIDDVPAAAARRLAEMGFQFPADVQRRGARPRQRLAALLGAAIMLLIATVLIIGLATITGWIRR